MAISQHDIATRSINALQLIDLTDFSWVYKLFTAANSSVSVLFGKCFRTRVMSNKNSSQVSLTSRSNLKSISSMRSKNDLSDECCSLIRTWCTYTTLFLYMSLSFLRILCRPIYHITYYTFLWLCVSSILHHNSCRLPIFPLDVISKHNSFILNTLFSS